MDNHVHDYYPIFSYFAEQLGQPLDWWANKKVLDFGGNHGNVLRDLNCTIKPENYHCLDVSQAALIKGNEDFPTAHWHHYNRFNLVYNFKGVREDHIPMSVIEHKYDVILAFSVFTTTSAEEMERTINRELLPMLKQGGVLMMTFLSLDDKRPLNFFLQKRLGFQERKKMAVRRRFEGRFYGYLVGSASAYFAEKDLMLQPQTVMLSFYKEDFIKNLWPYGQIKKYVLNEIQHCLILQN